MPPSPSVIIVGSGSAGLSAALWLSLHQIPFLILERRPGPLEMGQADGVQCRTVEVFESFGLAEQLLKEAYHVLELAFWSSDGKGGIKRSHRAADTEKGLSHMPHVILNQARVNGLLLRRVGELGGRGVEYGVEVVGVEVHGEGGEERGVKVTARREGREVVYRAKYVLGCDGAHSAVRRSLGFTMIGDSSDSVWGVMDIYPRSNFPDMRRKCTIRSESGVIVLIPREGRSLVRLYVELPPGQKAKDVKLEDLHETARRIFSPYTLEMAETAWWSAYPIGQRHADHFHKDYRVFLTGDACHTHSPKAGQGMNVSLQDGYNIGWKLAHVLRGYSPPSLLETYVLERRKVAVDLIDFDRQWTKMFATKANGESEESSRYFTEQFLKAGRYTAGLTAKYDESSITAPGTEASQLARNLEAGMRLPSTQVVRFCDSKAMQLVNAFPADGRWRLLIFAGDLNRTESTKRLKLLAEFFESSSGPILRATPSTADIDAFIEPVVLLSSKRTEVEQEQIPEYFWPPTGKWGVRDLHKVYSDDESYNSGHGHAYEFYGVDPQQGAIVTVRPDQYVAKITDLENLESIDQFFKGFILPQR